MVPGLWLAGLLAAPFHAAADGAALYAVADRHLYRVASDTAETTLVAKLDVDVQSMAMLNGSLHVASSGDVPALYRVAADNMTTLIGSFDYSGYSGDEGNPLFRGLERIGGDVLAVEFETLYRINLATGTAVLWGWIYETGVADFWGVLRRDGLTYLSNQDGLYILHDDFRVRWLGVSSMYNLRSLKEHGSKTYTIGRREIGASQRHLCEVDFSDGSCTSVGEIPGKDPTGLVSFEGTLYLSDSGNQDLYRIDSVENGVSTTLISSDVGAIIYDMVNVDGVIYALGELPDSYNAFIQTLDLVNGRATLINSIRTVRISSFTSVALAPLGGKLFAAASGSLHTVNAGTGAVTTGYLGEASPVGSMGLTATALAALGKRLYAAADGNLYSVNTETGATTHIGAMGVTASDLSGRGDTLYAIAGSNLYSLNTDTGAATLIGAMGITPQALAWTQFTPTSPPPNSPPVAVADSAETARGTTVSIDVLANDTDADDDALSVQSVTQPANGMTAISGDGAVTYSPDAAFLGEDSFSYTLSDGIDTATATVTVTVVSSPPPPFEVSYDEDAHRIVISINQDVGDGYQIEETIGDTVRTYPVQGLEWVKVNPEQGTHSFRLRTCVKGVCQWSTHSAATVAVTGPFAAEPSEETNTVPGSLPYDTGVTKGGDAYVNIPIAPAPGVNGLAPRLSIDYSGGRERQRVDEELPGDILGYGWRIGGFSAISRCSKNKAKDDVTLGLCLDGEPLVMVSGDRLAPGAEYRTYRESYVKIVVKGTVAEPWFEAKLPDGATREYGSTEDSRLRHTASGGLTLLAQTLLWSVSRETDAFGNAMTYRYHEDEARGVRHPRWIKYGLNGDAEVRFWYAGREDVEPVPFGEGMRSEPLLLHRVDLRLNDRPVREYRLLSETAAEGWRRLNKVQLCAYDERGANRECLAPMDFGWAESDVLAPGFKTNVTRFTDPLGRVTAFEHGMIKATGEHSFLFDELPFGPAVAPQGATPLPAAADGAIKQVVTAMQRGDGVGGVRRTSYAYHGKGFMGSRNWGFLGFFATRTTDETSGVVTYHQYRLDLPHFAKVSAVYQYDRNYDPNDSALEMLTKRVTERTVHNVSHGAKTTRLPYVKRDTQEFYEGGGALGAVQTHWALSFDASGLPVRTTQTTTAGRGAFSAPRSGVWGRGPIYDFSSRLRKATSTFDLRNRTGTGQWLVGFACRGTVRHHRNGGAFVERERWTSYAPHGNTLEVASATRFASLSDANCPMQAGTAAPTSQPGYELTTSYAYDAQGNLTETEVSPSMRGHVVGRKASVSNFVDERYPGTLTNAAGHRETYTYDPRFGLVKNSTDANGRTAERLYDSFGRLLRHTSADGVATTTTHAWCSAGASCASVGGVAPVMLSRTRSPTAPTVTRYFDRLGRLIRTETESFDGATVVREDAHYDSRGRIRKASRPYYERDYHKLRRTPDILYEYDHRDRVTKETRPDGGETTYAYAASPDGGGVQVTAAEKVVLPEGLLSETQTTVSIHNLLGELVERTEAHGASEAVTTAYAYDASGLLDRVTVDGDYVTDFDYDAAGNRTRVRNPNFGTLSFAYTALGELRTRTDALGNETAYGYDVLGRLASRRDSARGGGADAGRWEYDAANGKGLLHRRCSFTLASAASPVPASCAGTPDFAETFAYGADARPSSMSTVIRADGLAKTYRHGFTYDAQGRPSTIAHPSGLTVRRQYNTRGHLWRILDNATSAALVTYDGLDAYGSVTGETRGNGLAVRRTFDLDSGRQTGATAALGSTMIQADRYAWRSNGTLRSRTAGAVGGAAVRTETFAHDALNRLTGATTTGGASRTLSMAYDALGNLTSRTSSADADPDLTGYVYKRRTGQREPGPNAVIRLREDGVRRNLSYDAAGRVVGDLLRQSPAGARRIEWSSRGQALSVSLGADAAAPEVRDEFRYGPDGGRRFHKSAWRDGEARRTERAFHAGRFEEWLPDALESEYRSVMRTQVAGGVVHVRTIDKSGNAADAFEHVHRDHLGSAVAVTDGQGAVLRRFAHDPFGGRRQSDWMRALGGTEQSALAGDGAARSALGFTGHPQLDRTGYVNMGGRLYDPVLGRFLSPDPAVADWRSGQDWNAYAYVANRPMSQVDPTGAVRAGPGCSLVSGVACLDSGGGPGAGGGFSGRPAQAWSVSVSVDWRVAWTPVVQVGPGFFGDFGFRGLSFDVSFLPIAYPVLTGSLQQVNVQAVADRQPADEPILSPGGGASVLENAWQGVAGVWRILQRERLVGSRINYAASVYEMGQHEYRIRGLICSRPVQGCDDELADRVFDYVNRIDVPFTSEDMVLGQHTLPGNNPIVHQASNRPRTTENVTLEGHIFHPGEVTHEVHFGNGDGILYYDVTGTGSGPFPSVNNDLGRLLFEPGVRDVLRRYAR